MLSFYLKSSLLGWSWNFTVISVWGRLRIWTHRGFSRAKLCNRSLKHLSILFFLNLYLVIEDHFTEPFAD